MTNDAMTAAPAGTAAPERMPWLSLFLLTAMGFVLVTMETMPAGLLSAIASGLSTSESTIGLMISAYALGTIVVTVPAITLTRGFRRKPLLLTAITVLVLGNTLTALSGVVALSLASRLLAGAASGVVWGMFAAYARKISPPSRAGLSLAVVSVGAPLGFALGTPLGSALGTAFGWRWSFGGLSAIGVIVLVLIVVVVPDVEGRSAASRLPVRRVISKPGVAVVLAVIAAWMLGHNTIYTYIEPYLRVAGNGIGVDVLLLLYGIASVVGVAITGAVIDRHPRTLLHASVLVFIAAAVTLLAVHASAPAVVVAAVLWGLGFGGASTQLQTALTVAGGDDADVASAFLPVAFNVAIFAAGIVGALLLTAFDGLVLPATMTVLGVVAFVLTLVGRRTAFPARWPASDDA
ncbi:MFS transporter [Curtobacterium sp. MCPF17_050]|uniref:MFS transporter n=1 Tax=Curtobacterium sp. MCPF17_050 TaxID=2175664 RepID=UPI000D89FF26|nr:MFS transporter [Curtobacterium sp. MCPF17_050]WIB16954.1 MFS transporter [Curtobacterium sp. MCPF17_050]